MKLFRTTLLAALILASAQISHAQDAAPAAGAADAGTISNTTTTTTTTTTPATSSGISPDIAVEVTPTDGAATDATLANTGGAPLVMSLAGLSLAAVAFGLRRKVSA